MTDPQPPAAAQGATSPATAPGPTPPAPPAAASSLRVWAGRLLVKVFRVPIDRVDADGTRWPSTKEQFIWDLLPDKLAPNKDGIIEPKRGPEVKWTENVADGDVPDMYKTAREYRQAADDTTRNLELKAARLATVLVALLTANAALVVYELTRLGPEPSVWRWVLVVASVIPGLFSVGWLVVGLTRAVDADQRMGITSRSSLEHAAADKRAALVTEVHGYRVSDWTRLNKADRLLGARAAVSRSMVCLVLSAAIALGLALHTTLTDESQSGTDGTTSTPTPAPTPTETPTRIASTRTPTSSPTPEPPAEPTKNPTKNPTKKPTQTPAPTETP